MTLPNISDLKSQAKRLRSALTERTGAPVSHAQALELIARQYGYRDWNTASAKCGRNGGGTFHVGDRVSGFYLQKPFTGEVTGLRKMGRSGQSKITVVFDTPVDVVSFDSFSAYRTRVTKLIDETGATPEKTSNGEPHMILRHQRAPQ